MAPKRKQSALSEVGFPAFAFAFTFTFLQSQLICPTSPPSSLLAHQRQSQQDQTFSNGLPTPHEHPNSSSIATDNYALLSASTTSDKPASVGACKRAATSSSQSHLLWQLKCPSSFLQPSTSTHPPNGLDPPHTEAEAGQQAEQVEPNSSGPSPPALLHHPNELLSPHTASEPGQLVEKADPISLGTSPPAVPNQPPSSQSPLQQAQASSPTPLTNLQASPHISHAQPPSPTAPSSLQVNPHTPHAPSEADPANAVSRLQRVPLTKHNLRIFTGATISNAVTPSRSNKNSGPGAMNSQKATSVLGVKMVLADNGMPMEDDAAIAKHPHVRTFAEVVVNKERQSPLRPGWIETVLEVRKKYADRNEATWSQKVWPVIHNPERNIWRGEGESSILEKEGWEAESWEKSGLDDNWDCLLDEGCILVLETDDLNIIALLESLPRVTNPKPDIAFGVSKEVFNSVETAVNDRYHEYVQVSRGTYHPWFLIETKTKGTIEEVEIQCCRGAAAFVNGTRQFIKDSDPDAFAAKRGPDLDSMAFSLALVPSCAHIFCHWANTEADGSVIFHMHFVKSFTLRNADSCVGLFRAINNILDWGLGDRLTFIKSVLAKIHALTAETGVKKRKRTQSAGGGQAGSSVAQVEGGEGSG